jgi:N-acetylated-alpha-linked acidic dipeptidase
MPNDVQSPTDSGLSPFEARLLDELDPDLPWKLIQRFSTLVRESGSEDERLAASYIAGQLRDLGIACQVYEPELHLSVPIEARVECGPERLRAKAASFSAPTGEGGLMGEVILAPDQEPERSDGDMAAPPSEDLRGRIVVSRGFGFPAAVRAYQEAGAMGLINIHPGDRIHWGYCTPIWGAPDLDTAHLKPHIPVLSVNRADGEKLVQRARSGETPVRLFTRMKEGWFPCPLVVAEIPGSVEPERFVLAHGHYDSWDVGVGDNATGDAALLELARIFHLHRDDLKRSLRLAWWPGHSTGRYAGSTWYADTFGLDLAENCIAQMNVDSPGCRWATEYEAVNWMAECEGFCRQAIRDATGKSSSGARPYQAGDYSFNNIGISSFYMLLSTMPERLVEEKGYYLVGGCGGNIEWHTEGDRLPIADMDNLMRDLRVYALSLGRALNRRVYPFDFRQLCAEFRVTLDDYSRQSGGRVDFRPALEALDGLEAELRRLYARMPSLQAEPAGSPQIRRINDCLLALGRTLIPINFTRQGRFRTEPAEQIAPLPDLAPARRVPGATGHERHVLQTHLQRGINRVCWAFERAAASAAECSQGIESVRSSPRRRQ